jgi:ADP-heptose:LPS heptosyltransferase
MSGASLHGTAELSRAKKRILVFRMSSLGDLILSTAFLESLSPEFEVDWVIAKEFAFVLRGHPRIRKLVIFDKKTGRAGWRKLISELSHEDYAHWIDLHATLRTRLARFWTWRKENIQWTALSKTRWKFLGYITFKKLWPENLRPELFWKRFAQIAMSLAENGGVREMKPPSYSPLLNESNDEPVLARYFLKSKSYAAIAPASRWSSKEWSPEKYAELCKQSSLKILLLGRKNDAACIAVEKYLTEENIPFHSALEEPNFHHTAILLKHAAFYLGGDTGLAHLAEAVGTRAEIIFGPTRPDLGFGPWRKESAAIQHAVWCSPCSKDGQICYRFGDRFACLKKLSVEEVRSAIQAGGAV